ncbi:MAG: Rossmann-like domain-containing protein [Promethearchaeota archaeon]
MLETNEINSINIELVQMAEFFTKKFNIPPIAEIYLPPYFKDQQPKWAEFMVMRLNDDTIGLSYVFSHEMKREEYESINLNDFIGKNPDDLYKKFLSNDLINKMFGMAAINAICQFVIKKSNLKLDYTTDPLGLLNIQPSDIVGMVGLFRPLLGIINTIGAKLIVIEKRKDLIQKFQKLNISNNPRELLKCNKILCTSTTILNNTLDEILSYSKNAEKISIIGPTAGFFPDPLFKRGITVVGGTQVKDGKAFMNLIKNHEKWSKTTSKYIFIKEKYEKNIKSYKYL